MLIWEEKIELVELSTCNRNYFFYEKEMFETK